jgi:similar to stage IV sporulation protein
MFSAGLIYYLSLYIWNIKIYGNYIYSEKEVIKVLNEHSVFPSVFKSKIDCENIKEILRNEFPEISWVSAAINGTVLEINIKENYDSEIAIKSREPYDIISNKKGTITKIITRSGTPLVVKGDEIEKGDILVSGIVYRYSDALEPISYELVNSDADIYASVEYDYAYEFEMVKENKIYTGKKNNKIYIGIGNNRIIFGKNKKYDNSTTITKESQLKLLSNFYLPIYYGTIIDMQFYPEKQIISKGEAKKISKDKYDLYIESLNQNDIVVISDNFSISFDNNKCISKSKLIVEEQIGTIKEIDKSNISIVNETEETTNDSMN